MLLIRQYFLESFREIRTRPKAANHIINTKREQINFFSDRLFEILKMHLIYLHLKISSGQFKILIISRQEIFQRMYASHNNAISP